MANKEKPLKVFAIEDNGGEKKYWHEVGVAFRNKDNSLNVKLYMLPLLRLQIPGTELEAGSNVSVRGMANRESRREDRRDDGLHNALA